MNLPTQNIPYTQSNIIIVAIFFTSFLILSNLTAFKISEIGPFIFPAGLIFFPLTYVFDDILTEVYGFKVSRRIIWLALFANTIIFLGTWVTIYLDPAPQWPHQNAYSTVYHATLRIFLASTLSYFFGEFVNSILLAKLKVKTKGRYLWLRLIMSTLIGVGVDTIIFAHIAFLFTIHYGELWKMITTVYTLKVIYEMTAIPLTYKIVRYLKQKDNTDYYDINTKFNLFSLEL